MKRNTRLQENGEPRTKGIRNPAVMYALLGCKGGAHTNKRDKRRDQKERRYEANAE